MENILIYLLAQAKHFLVGVFAGMVIQGFEIQVGNTTFKASRFFFGSLSYGFLTWFGYQMIKAGFISGSEYNDEAMMVMSIMIATFLYLFVPFVLKEENRSRFIESVMEKFGFVKQEKGKRK